MQAQGVLRDLLIEDADDRRVRAPGTEDTRGKAGKWRWKRRRKPHERRTEEGKGG